jgi:uncharacterized membrane protein YhaH (DUF805 family)
MFSFYGRINRAKYWLGCGIIFVAAIVFVTAIIVTTAYFRVSPEGSQEEEATLFGQQWAAPIIVFFLIASVSTLSLTVKRLRDLATSVWWVLPIGMIAFGRFYTSEEVRGVLELIQFGATVWLGIKKGKEDKTGLGSQQENRDWYYAEGQETAGPISHDQLVALLREASRPTDVLVWQSGFQDWAKVGDLPQLLRAIKPPPRLPNTTVAIFGWF